jgi:hypothetical protein
VGHGSLYGGANRKAGRRRWLLINMDCLSSWISAHREMEFRIADAFAASLSVPTADEQTPIG